MVSSFWRNRQLIFQMAKRETVGRYRGSILGIAWSFFNPLVMLVIYTFVFSVVFKARWGMEDESKADFAIILFIGLIVHGLFSECLNRAPTLIIANANYVKKVVFPLEILPWVAFGSALFHASVSFCVLLCAQLALQHSIPPTAVLLPLVVLPLVLATMGLCWFIAAAGVYLRDIGQLTGVLTTITLYISAVFFPITSLPEQYQPILRANPLAFIIEQAREVAVFGRTPDLHGWVVGVAMSGAHARQG
jgi:lipopolysaccharide transport system permease protein